MNKNLMKLLIFSMILFIGLTIVCASDVDDTLAVADDVAASDASVDISPVTNVVEDYNSDNNGQLNEDGDIDPGASPTQYTSISQTTYENAVITLSGNQYFTDGVATFSNNVTLTSDDAKRTLTNFKIIVNGNNVTINNVAFNHQTSSATKVIDVTGGSDVLINNTDITLTKNIDVTTMAINIDNNANNVVVNSTDIVVNGAAQTLWHQDENQNWYDELMISGVNMDRASYVTIANSTVKMINTTNAVSVGTTMPAIAVKNTANNIKVANNTINSTGATYVYGVMCNDYVNNINISGNKVNVTGEIYTAGIDASTTINSYVYENKILANSTNVQGFGYKQEALAYGIVLATYQTGNTNNNASNNNITLVANVAYGIENYLGSGNIIDYNNISINAKRGLGIATNASNANYYRNNKINITCNQDAISDYDETIPAQNVGIIVINGSSNTISNNQINITENVATTTAYSIKLDVDSSSNTGEENELYVYKYNNIQTYGSGSILDQGFNNIFEDTIPQTAPVLNTLNNLLSSKNIKHDDVSILINGDNYTNYGSLSSTTLRINKNIQANQKYILDVDSINTNARSIMFQSTDSSVHLQIIASHIYTVIAPVTVEDTYLPWANLQMGHTLINSVFLTGQNTVVLINSTIYSLENNVIALDPSKYGSYFDTTSNILLDSVAEGSMIILRNYSTNSHNYINPMIINKPVTITSFDNTIYNGDIMFVAGSEGSNLTGLTLNGNLYINTSNISVKNNTINKAIIIKDASDVVVEENTFNTETTAIEVVGGIQNTIQNNNITTTSTYTITLDADSLENTISGNNLQAAQLTGVGSVLDEGEDNIITDGGDEPVIVEPVLKIDTTEFSIGETTAITASIYMGDEVATDINGGKVVFKVDGKTLKDANGKVIYAKVVNGTATIASYEIPNSWNKENVTITAVYSGTSKQEALTSEATQITTTQAEPTITTDDIFTTTGETVQLKAKVSIADNPITTGKVVFKINGKTVKDANGKVIYATVDETGEVSVNYTIPDTMKADYNNITAVFTSATYGKLQATSILSIQATVPDITNGTVISG